VQIVERVPREAHDLCVDLVVTEERTIETGCRAARAKT
jgi:5-formyltetrahydrofolate cyclo-ligase